MMRRPLWLAAGAALGAGGTLWTRRRLERLSRRVRPASVAGDIVSMVDRTRRGTTDRVRDAVDAGRAGARRREDDLWRDLGTGDSGAWAQHATPAEHARGRPGYHRLPR
jgi:hypothetical protein